jgi:hypothetical protein
VTRLSKILVALATLIRYNASHLNRPEERGRIWQPGQAITLQRWFQEETARMLKKSIVLGVMILLSLTLTSGPAPAAAEKMFTYDYTFKPGTEPDGFRGLKWGTDIATLDPLHTMEVLAIVGPFVYYKKNQEDLRLVNVELDDIIYEFWNGKFSGVVIKVRGPRQFQILKDYVFARFGEGQRSKALQQLDVQDFYYNGVRTRMSLKYSDMEHAGELAMYSVALLAQQQKVDTFYYRDRARAQIEAWEKAKGK